MVNVIVSKRRIKKSCEWKVKLQDDNGYTVKVSVINNYVTLWIRDDTFWDIACGLAYLLRDKQHQVTCSNDMQNIVVGYLS